MRTGIVTTSQPILPFLLALAIAIAGCDRAVPRPVQTQSAAASPLDPSDIARERRDPARNRVWILGAAGAFIYHTDTGKLVELSLPSWQWVDVPYGCPPDLAIGTDGEAVVTSNILPVLWRVDAKTLAVTVHELALDADREKDVGFSGLVYSAEHRAYFAVSETQGSLWQVDAALRTASKIARLTPVREACSVALPRGAG